MWDRIVDTADVITAISAVVAIVLAAWLGLRALQVAKSGNDSAQQEFLYNQVEGLLQAALGLTAVAAEARVESQDSRSAQRTPIQVASERFDSRVRVLTELNIATDGVAAIEVRQFALALTRASLALMELRTDRQVLRRTILDGRDDVTSDFLKELASALFGQSYQDPSTLEDVVTDDGTGVSDNLSGDPEVTDTLRANLSDPEHRYIFDESLRVVLPWINVKLDLWEDLVDEDGETTGLRSGELDQFDFDGEKVVPAHWDPAPVFEWVQDWPKRFYNHNYDPDSSWTPKLSPEEVMARFTADLASEFLDRLVGFVRHLQAGLAQLQAEPRTFWQP